MIRLFANTQDDTSRQELDVEGLVEITFSGKQIDEVGKNAGSYSAQVVMPFSNNNSQFFEYYYDVNVEQDTFNHYQSVDVEVYDDQNLLMTGQMQLLSVNVFTKKYEIMIANDAVSFFHAIRGMSWRDLYSDATGVNVELDHQLTETNVVNSWDTTQDITLGQVGDGTIVYPMTDSSKVAYNPKRWFYNGDAVLNIWQQGITQDNFIQPNTLKPAILIRYLIAKIFQKTGFVYESTFLSSSHVDKLYMLLATHLEFPSTRAALGAKATLSSNLTVDYTSTDYVQYVFDTEVYDADNVIQQGNFIAPYSGTFQLKIVTIATGVAGDDFVLGAQINNAGPVYTQTSQILNSTTAGTIDYFTLSLEEGDVVRFYIRVYSTANMIVQSASSLELYLYQAADSYVDVVGCLPDCTVDEWLRALSKQFNLVFAPKTNASRTIIIETVEDYYNLTGPTKDWTQKVDLDKDVIVRPTTLEQKKRVIFEDAEGKDFGNAYWQHAFQKVKGRFIYENDNTYAQGDEKVGDFFVPLRVRNVGTFEDHATSLLPDFFVITQWNLRNGVAQSTTGKPILMYYHGTKDVGASIKVGTTATTVYPLFTHLSATTGEPLSLRWGHDWPDHQGHQYFPFTRFHLFRQYHAKHMDRVYNVDARTLYCHMHLKSSDINQLSMYDRVWVYNAYYRLVSIGNYAIGKPRTAAVQLIKDIEVQQFGCDITPNNFNDDGTISFVDVKTGLPSSPTEECCTFYGYAWNPSDNACYWSGGSDTGGEPPVTPWGDSTTIDNISPPLPPQEEQNDENTGLSGNIVDNVMFGETVSNETISLNDQLNASQIYLGQGPSYAGTIHVLGKKLSNGALVSELIEFNYNTETATLNASSVEKNGSFGTIVVRESTSSDGVQVDITGVNNEPCSWIARVNVLSIRTDYHLLPTVSDSHDANAIWNGETTEMYITFNGDGAFLIFNG